LRGFDNLRDKWNALKNIFKNRGYVTESRFFEKYAKGEMKFAESLNEKYYRSLFNKMTTIPGKLRDAFDKDVVRYGIKTFEIIKDNETIIVNDALWARLKNAGVK